MTHSNFAAVRSFRLQHPMPPVLPGILLCLLITRVAYVIAASEAALLGKAWLAALALAILLGTAVCSIWTPNPIWHAGIAFVAKYMPEIAVMLLGASVSAAMIATAGPDLLLGIGVVMTVTILASFCIGKPLRLPTRMALLIACGNSICGNSAIAAVVPVIGADGDEVATSIDFTAVLGVVVALGLPILGLALGRGGVAYGAFTGLTVYAVPQVLAASAPMGVVAEQIGTIVKRVRVLMLAPVCKVLSLLAPYLAPINISAKSNVTGGDLPRQRPSIMRPVPWFIIGFQIMVICRSQGLVPQGAIAPIGHLATLLTVASMAALGLGVDVRNLAQAGGRVTVTVVLSLLMLGVISFGLLWLLAMV